MMNVKVIGKLRNNSVFFFQADETKKKEPKHQKAIKALKKANIDEIDSKN